MYLWHKALSSVSADYLEFQIIPAEKKSASKIMSAYNILF